ncbi:hypothetical protein [Sphingomonas sp. LY160]|uniref:hypothetical protein n=1 Tax=Sphingomonas sp. LY160 TaxID=3095342 RepID=UPI002ADEBE71|nr:hypothetical protein [Sphingomonas sp. LY160]MEA1071103.1 hypothetical protein [Sphingomonas sp. LY160]
MRTPNRPQGTEQATLGEASTSSSNAKDRAAQGPMPEPVSAAENALPEGRKDSPSEAEGRRTLSTAFVRVGPDGLLTVQLRGGRSLLLRNVQMNARDYCGTQVSEGREGKRFCGGYADVVGARAGSS